MLSKNVVGKAVSFSKVILALYVIFIVAMALVDLYATIADKSYGILQRRAINPIGMFVHWLFREEGMSDSKPQVMRKVSLPNRSPVVKEDEAAYDLYSASIADAELRRSKAHVGTLDKEILPSPIPRGYSGQNAETRSHVRDPSDVVPDEVMNNANSGVIKGMRFFNPNTFNNEGNFDQEMVDINTDTRQLETPCNHHEISI